ncbi:hypothetical protein ACFFRR_006195 [Megaselia abdita]
MSDFSIDYILNRAGVNSCITIPDRIKHEDNSFEPINYRMPMFDWLQYTRYKPPRLQRPMRQGPVKRTPGRLPRVPFTPAQLNALENSYKLSTYLSSEEANKLADKLGLTSTRVKIWFQNRRARERREKRERGEPAELNMSSSPCSSPERYYSEVDVDSP